MTRKIRWTAALCALVLLLTMATASAQVKTLNNELKISLTSDKSSYSAGEPIVATLSATNLTAADITGVELAHQIPNGFILVSGELSRTVNIAAGQTATLQVTLRSDGSLPALPDTGDDSGMLLWMLLLAGAGAGLLILRSRHRKRVFAMILAVVLAGAALPAAPAMAAERLWENGPLPPNFFEDNADQVKQFLDARLEELLLKQGVSYGGRGVTLEGSASYKPNVTYGELLTIAYYVASMPGRDGVQVNPLTAAVTAFVINWYTNGMDGDFGYDDVELLVNQGKAGTREFTAELLFGQFSYYYHYLYDKIDEAEDPRIKENAEELQLALAAWWDSLNMDEYSSYLEWAIGEGLMPSKDGKIDPTGSVTEEEAQKILAMVQAYFKKNNPLGIFDPYLYPVEKSMMNR